MYILKTEIYIRALKTASLLKSKATTETAVGS